MKKRTSLSPLIRTISSSSSSISQPILLNIFTACACLASSPCHHIFAKRFRVCGLFCSETTSPSSTLSPIKPIKFAFDRIIELIASCRATGFKFSILANAFLAMTGLICNVSPFSNSNGLPIALSKLRLIWFTIFLLYFSLLCA